jgi:hypothetical protein
MPDPGLLDSKLLRYNRLLSGASKEVLTERSQFIRIETIKIIRDGTAQIAVNVSLEVKKEEY